MDMYRRGALSSPKERQRGLIHIRPVRVFLHVSGLCSVRRATEKTNTMTFTRLQLLILSLGQLTATVLSESSCPHHHNVSTPDANCTFEGQTWCSWQNVDGDQLDWQFYTDWGGNAKIYMKTLWKDVGTNAYLAGPPMCEQVGSGLCLQFRYMMDVSHGGKISVFLCAQWEAKCNKTTVWSTTDWADGEWQDVRVPLESPGIFQIIIEGQKYEDKGGRDSDIYLDDISYTNVKCEAVQEPGYTSTEAGSAATGSPQGTRAGHVLSTQYTVTSRESKDNNLLSTNDTTPPGIYQKNFEGQDKQDSDTINNSSSGDGDGSVMIVVIVVVVVVMLLIATTATVIVVVVKRRKSKCNSGHTNGEVNYSRNDSLVVSNAIYSLTGDDDSCDLRNDLENFENHNQTGLTCTTTTTTTTTTAEEATSNDCSPNDDQHYSTLSDTAQASNHTKGNNPSSETKARPELPDAVAREESRAGQTAARQSKEGDYVNMPDGSQCPENIYHNF